MAKSNILAFGSREEDWLIFIKVLVLRDVAMYLHSVCMAFWIDVIFHVIRLESVQHFSSILVGFVQFGVLNERSIYLCNIVLIFVEHLVSIVSVVGVSELEVLPLEVAGKAAGELRVNRLHCMDLVLLPFFIITV